MSALRRSIEALFELRLHTKRKQLPHPHYRIIGGKLKYLRILRSLHRRGA